MKNSEYLFFLIKSMGKRDKDNLMRYTRVRGKKTDHKYMDLFHAIDGQRTYNEKALKEEFNLGNFSEAKKHLIQLILKVLRVYHQHPETEVQNQLTEIRILLDRSLYHFALKKIRIIREWAFREERYGVLNRLADYELEALPFVSDPKAVHARREEIVQLREEAQEHQAMIDRLKDIRDKDMGAVLNQASQLGRFSSDLVQELEQLPALQIPDEELPLRARAIKYRIWNVIYHQQLDFKRRAGVLAKMVKLFEEHPFLIGEEQVRYIFALGGYGLCLNVIRQYERALVATRKLREIRTESPNLLRSIFLNYATNISIYTLNTGDTAPFNENLPYLLSALKEHQEQTPGATLTYIHYLLAIDFWLAGDIRRANRFARKVVEEPSGRLNLQAACRCFLLVFAYEESDPEMIIQYARSWKRQWKKKAPSYQVEQLFTQFMVKLVDLASREEVVAAMEKCHQDLDEVMKGGFQVRADNFIFLIHWLESRLEKESLVDVVRAKATSNT